MKKIVIHIIYFSLILLYNCTPDSKTLDFKGILTEPCMIVNLEQDNTIEGNYLCIETFNKQDSSITLKLPADFFVTNLNLSNWLIGWGTNKPLYDGGTENLREIQKIDTVSQTIYLGKIARGLGFPEEKQRVIFINKNPSGFKNKTQKPILNLANWPTFKGKSVSFGTVQFDSLLHQWVMLFNECDTSFINIYAAQSTNLIDWMPANNGLPILTEVDFKNASWCGNDRSGKVKQTPIVSDAIYEKGSWYLFLDGYDTQGKRQIGMAVSTQSILGPYVINSKPIISVGEKNSWNEVSSFYAKVCKNKNEFVLVYDGRSTDGVEQLGIAKSSDLINWTNSKDNPVLTSHSGWRSSTNCSEPSYINVSNDTLFLLVSGVKKSKANFWHHYVTKRMYMDVSGNVEQTELGLYFSIDGGNTFVAHQHNPVFINDFSNPYENAHMGGNFKYIHTDTTDFVFYQAKSTYEGLKYTILLRTKDFK